MSAEPQAKPLLLSTNANHANNHAHKKASNDSSNKKSRYIVLHQHDTSLIPFMDETPNAHSRHLNATHRITFVDLTADQAAELAKHLSTANGSIHANQERTLDFVGTPPPALEPENEQVIEATAATTPYLTTAVTCPATTIAKDIVMFFPDTMVDVKKFPKANLHIGNNYSGTNKPCNPHSNYTFSIFEQVLGDPKLSATNIPVFTCGGGSLDSAIVNGFLDILDFAKANPNLRVGVYFATSGGGQNAAYTAVIQELVKTGVLLAVSAGNESFNLCAKNIPPWNVAGVLQIGGTQAPGNQCSWFTNWSDYGNDQTKDCVNVYLPSVFTIKQFNVKEQGTSFAVPQALGEILRWWTANPGTTAQQAIAAFKQKAVVIKAEGPTSYPPYTTDKLIPVMEKANFCECNCGCKNKPKPNI